MFPSLCKRRFLLTKKIFSLVLLFGLLVQPITPSLFAGGFFIPTAQAEDDVTSNDEEEAEESEEEEVSADEETTPTETEEVNTEAATEEAADPEETESSEKNESSEDDTTEEQKVTSEEKEEVAVWRTEGDKASTTEAVKVDTKYEAPQNKDVTVTFTKLPEAPGTLTIEEITLTKEQIEATGSLSDKAYDITSSMENGSFEYELTLPIPEGKKDVQVKYADNVDGLKEAETVKEGDIKTEGDSITAELNHFTVFIVTNPALTGGACITAGATTASDCYDTIEAAVSAASNGDIIEIQSNLSVTSAITLNKALTIRGAGGAVINTSGGNQLFTITANDVTISDLTFNKTDKTSQHFIGVQASNVTISNNTFVGQFIQGEGDVARAIVVSGGVADLSITGNSFSSLRQPAYINNDSSGDITNNYVTGTRGWVVEKASDFAFTGNTWGTNILDIAIIPGVDPASTPNNYTCQIPAMQSANSGANIQDQYPAVGPCPDFTAPTTPGQIGWTTENPPVGSDYTGGSDFSDYKTCGASLNQSPITNFWAPSTDTNGIASYEREVYSPDAATLNFAHSLTTNHVNGGGAVDGQTYWVRVRAIDTAGNPSAWTPKCAITYDSTAPLAPTVTVNESGGDPIVNGGLTNSYGITVNWNAVAGASSYEYRYSNSIPGNPYNAPNFYPVTGITSTSLSGVFNQGDGLHHVEVRAIDAAGNASPWSTIFNINYDGTVPAIPTLVSPADGVPVNGTTPVANDWNDVVDADHYIYQSYNVDGAGNCNLASIRFTSDYIASQTNSRTFADGLKFCWRVKAVDAAGNESDWSSLWKTIADNTAPTVPTNGLPNGTYELDNEFDFTWDASTDSSSITYQFQSSLNGAQTGGVLTTDLWISPAPLPSNMIHSSGAPDGKWYWQVRAQDAAGNWSNWSSIWDVTIDSVAPTVPVHQSPADNTFTTTALQTSIDWSDSTDTNGPVKYEYQSSNSNDVDGNGSFVSPVFTSNPLLTSSEIPTPGTPEGVYYWHVRAQDAAGNWSAWSTPWKITVDNTNPVDPTSVTSTSHLTGVWSGDGTVDVTWSGASDNLSGVDGFYTEWNNSPDTINGSKVKEYEETATSETSPLFASGQPYYFHIATLDNAGNWTSTAHLGPFQIDRTNPTVSWTEPNSIISYVGGAAVNLAVSAFDAHSGVQNVTFAYSSLPFFFWIPVAVDVASPYVTTWDTTGLTDGLYSLRAVVRDNVNRTTQAFRLVITDNTDPVTTDSGTDANWHNTDVTVTLSCTDGFLIGSGCDTTYYTTDGSDPTTSSSVYSGSIVISTEGITTIKYFSVDNVGNEEAVKTTTNTVKIDKTAPTALYAISPANPDGDNDWYTSIPTVTLTADDGGLSGVDYIEYRLNGGAWVTYVSPFTLSDGAWTVEYRAFDIATNESATGSSTAKVDTEDPDEVNDLDAEYDDTEDEVELTWDVDDNDIDRVLVYRGGSSNFNTNSGNKIGENDDNDDTMSDGDVSVGDTYYYKVVSQDEAGNRSGANTIKVEIENDGTGGGTAIVTNLGVQTDTEGTVAGATTETGEGTTEEGGTEEGEILGATTENSATNGLMDFIKKYSWWWLIILLIIGYTGYKYYSKKQNPLV